jgi:hypothetical protein
LLPDSLGGLQANLLPLLPSSIRASSTQSSQDQGPYPHLFLVPPAGHLHPSLGPPIPRHLCSRQGCSVMEALGPQEAGDVQATLSQNCCCFRSTGLASALPTVSAVGLLSCLLDPGHFL